MNTVLTYQYLIDPEQVREALKAFEGQPIIGLDTETYWDYPSRQNRLSLLQLAAPTGEVVVIDGLTAGIEEARRLIENPQSLMAAHNARFDDGVLRQSGFAAAGLVDTLRLSRRVLKLESFSLASVSHHLLGVSLDKTYQQSDWRRRPLSKEQLNYAALDARVAMLVFQELATELEMQGKLKDEMRRALVGPRAEGSDRRDRSPRSKRPSVQLRPLTAEERRLVEQLQRWRRKIAENERIPAYLVCRDKTFEHLAIVRPGTIEELSNIFGLGPSKIERYGAALLTQLLADGQ